MRFACASVTGLNPPIPNHGRAARDVAATLRKATKLAAAGTCATDIRRTSQGALAKSGPAGPVSKMPNGTASNGPVGATTRSVAPSKFPETTPSVAA